MALGDMKTFGLNTFGVHTDAPSLTEAPLGPVMPYVRRYEPVILSHYRNPKHIDIFEPEFEKQCEERAKEMAGPYVNDPMILGYCMSDLPSMTDIDAEMYNSTTWPRELRTHAHLSLWPFDQSHGLFLATQLMDQNLMPKKNEP